MKGKAVQFSIILSVLTVLSSCGSDSGRAIEDYIVENQLETTELQGGVFVIIEEEGSQNKPTIDDYVYVDYTGKLTNEDQVLSSEELFVKMSSTIECWKIGLPEIGVGGRIQILTPSDKAFGDSSFEEIPANSDMIFDVELLEIFANQSVEEYVFSNGLDTKILEGGVQIEVQNQGTGPKVESNSIVKASYEGRLTNDRVFDSGNDVEFNLSGVIEGWQIGLQELSEGGSGTLVIPASAAYGQNEVGNIPSGATLVFDVTIHEVK